MSDYKPTSKALTKNNTKVLVYQHNELIEATYKMSLPTKRLFLILLSMFNPKGSNNGRFMVVHAKDYAIACGIDVKVAYKQLCRAADELVGCKIRTHCPIKHTREVYVISGYAKYYDNAGYIQCDLYTKILPLIQKFKGNFTAFRLAEGIKFKRFYSIRLYELLMTKDSDKMHRRFKISVEEFRIILDINHFKTYKDFAQLNNQVIAPSLKEIEQKTDLIIKLELKRYGRRISHLIFTFDRDIQQDMFK